MREHRLIFVFVAIIPFPRAMIWLLQKTSDITVVVLLLILSLLASVGSSSTTSRSANNKRGSVAIHALLQRTFHHHPHHSQHQHHYSSVPPTDTRGCHHDKALLQRFFYLSSLKRSRLAFAASSSTPSRNNNNKKRGGGGGGFGSSGSTSSSSSSSSSASSSKKNNKRSKSSNKKTLSLKDDIFQQQQQQQEKQVALDKWGLPPPTIEDIFPRMPPGTELIAARRCNEKEAQEESSSSSAYTLAEIQAAIQNCLPLPGLSNFFDQDGEQKSSTFFQDDNDDDEDDNNCRRKPMKLRLVHESPAVLVIDNFLSRRECLEIEQIAMLASSTRSRKSSNQQVIEVGSALFSEGSSYATTTSQLTKRTSTSWFCEYKAVPQLLTAAHYVLGLNIKDMEEPQIVRYQTGQEFTWHYDQVPSSLLSNGGQRMATLLVYLNTVQQGGGTVFRDLKPAAEGHRRDANDDNQQNTDVEEEEENMLTVQPVQGRACLFFPATFANSGTTRIARPDDRTLHKGQVVTMDGCEKRIAQIWIHQDTYKATLPSTLNRQEDAIPAIQQLAQRQWDETTKDDN